VTISAAVADMGNGIRYRPFCRAHLIGPVPLPAPAPAFAAGWAEVAIFEARPVVSAIAMSGAGLTVAAPVRALAPAIVASTSIRASIAPLARFGAASAIAGSGRFSGGRAVAEAARIGGCDCRREARLDHLVHLAAQRPHLDAAVGDGDVRALLVDVDGELGPLDQSHEVGRAHGKMRRRPMLDPILGPAGSLYHADVSALFRRTRNPQLGARRDDDEVSAADQHRTPVRSGADDLARSHGTAAPRRDDLRAAVNLDLSGRLGDSPRGGLREGGGAPDQEQKGDQRTNRHKTILARKGGPEACGLDPRD
jgi:hypothetical protein